MSIVSVQKLTVRFGSGFLRRAPSVLALKDVDLTVASGACHGLLGESGSGKTTLGRAILGLARPTSGDVIVSGVRPYDLSPSGRKKFSRNVQCMFQDSGAVLNPRLTVGASVREGLDIHQIGSPTERAEEVASLLRRVSLDPALAERFPHQLSGGQRQRVTLARCLAVRPKVLVADEPLSALDVSVQAHVLDLLAEIRVAYGLTLIFISHDLKVARAICDEVSVMKAGEVVESGPAADVLAAPAHPYTQNLLASLPRPRFPTARSDDGPTQLQPSPTLSRGVSAAG